MREQKDINRRIGAGIKRVREGAGYTQEQLSEVLGITPNHLSAVERGASGASLELLEKLCLHFCVSVDSLFFGEGENGCDTLAPLARYMEKVSPRQREQVRKILLAVAELAEGSE